MAKVWVERLSERSTAAPNREGVPRLHYAPRGAVRMGALGTDPQGVCSNYFDSDPGKGWNPKYVSGLHRSTLTVLWIDPIRGESSVGVRC
jgi:hypothetical protein